MRDESKIIVSSGQSVAKRSPLPNAKRPIQRPETPEAAAFRRLDFADKPDMLVAMMHQPMQTAFSHVSRIFPIAES